MNQQSYYAVIPANVRYSKEVSDGAKLLYGEITALSNQNGYCWATNKYFADLYGKSSDTVSRWISELSAAGFIVTLVDSSAANSRKIWLAGSPGVSAKMPTPIGKNASTLSAKMPTPIGKNAEQNNTVNTTLNTTLKNNAGASDPLSPPFQKVDEIYPETFSLEAEKAEPLHRGPGAVRVSITDPEFPGVTVVHAVGPKTNPTKTGREKQQRNAPNIHPENETVFQHFSDPAKARAAWAEWLQYKYDQHRERYKNAKSELVKLRSLWEETKGDAAQVERNISHSIGNLYRGIFAPKAEKNGTQQPNGLNKATAQHLDLAQYVGQRRIAAMERAMQNGTLASAPEERQF